MTDTVIETETTAATAPQERSLPEALGTRRIAELLADHGVGDQSNRGYR
ncbi:hypothetical protein AB0D68_25500 [Streptomyces sp. NPDC048212]|nr:MULTISPECIES: hypothetical protein [unclassified Streptomyces]MCY1649294.1 hypothetical protein [Streptomyces sp. SL203]MCY1677006.1 hypothetical protein [Streptomyces sp. SL294]